MQKKEEKQRRKYTKNSERKSEETYNFYRIKMKNEEKYAKEKKY